MFPFFPTLPRQIFSEKNRNDRKSSRSLEGQTTTHDRASVAPDRSVGRNYQKNVWPTSVPSPDVAEDRIKHVYATDNHNEMAIAPTAAHAHRPSYASLECGEAQSSGLFPMCRVY